MITKPDNRELVQNLEKCHHFDRCNQNLCPLDLELGLRYGGKQDRCRYFREPKKANIAGREFVSGGAIMPDAPLKFVPQRNSERLNEASKGRWQEINQLI